MVRSDQGAAGVMFTLDTESGFRDVVFITANYGLGETVVQGAVNPDEFYVHKPMLAAGKFAIVRRNLGSKLIKMVFEEGAEDGGRHVDDGRCADAQRYRFSLSDDEVLELARYAVTIEQHYGRPMDIEWGKDGIDGALYILQARPETVQSRPQRGKPSCATGSRQRGDGAGRGPGDRAKDRHGQGAARARRYADGASPAGRHPGHGDDRPELGAGDEARGGHRHRSGGRTCHAAIIARELGIPAVVGCGDATQRLRDGAEVTVSCAEGDTGNVYARRAGNGGRPCSAAPAANAGEDHDERGQSATGLRFQSLPNAGVGLARLEFIINNTHRRASEGSARLSEPG